MAQTLFMVLKQQNPDCCIEVLAPAWSQALLSRMPEVHASFISPFAHGQLSLYARYTLGKQLRKNEYDQVIVLPNSAKSALVPLWAHIPQRTAWRGEWPRALLLNDVRSLDKKKLPLMIQRFAALGLPKDATLPAQLPYPRLSVSPSALADSLTKYDIKRTNAPLLVLAPGAEFGPSKRWPALYFAEVAAAKLAQGWDVWMFGSTKDISIGEEIQQHTAHKVTNFIGKTSLAEAIDLISLADMVVSNDSGLMHIAAALNRPLIALYGSTSPEFTPPLGDKVQILNLHLPCSPCFQRTCPLQHWRCMLDLKPELVLSHIEAMHSQGNRALSFS